jgi:DEAD/DEAH box helicase domain-containing protein
MKQLFLDVETTKTFDEVGGYFPEKLGVSFIGLIERDGFPETGGGTETHHQLFARHLDALPKLLNTADLIIGFNLDGFDLPALSAHYHGDLTSLPTLDLLTVIKNQAGHRISLDAVAQETLGVAKSGSGLDAIRYYHQKEWDKLASYCMKDVAITRDLYDHGRLHHMVKFKNKWNNLIELPIDFSPPLARGSGTQMSLV